MARKRSDGARPVQQTYSKSAIVADGAAPRLYAEGRNPDGIYSGMTKRLRLTDGTFSPAGAEVPRKRKRD